MALCLSFEMSAFLVADLLLKNRSTDSAVSFETRIECLFTGRWITGWTNIVGGGGGVRETDDCGGSSV